MVRFGFALLFSMSLAFASLAKQPMPDFELAYYKQTQTLSKEALQGKVLYVDFWASWCGPCRKTFPFMNDLHSRFEPSEFQVIAINMDENIEDADKFLERYPAQFPIFIDQQNTLAKQLELPGLPTAYIVDKQGVIRAVHTGFRERTKQKTIEQIRYLVEQE